MNESLPIDDALLIEGLCAYQARLDQGSADDSTTNAPEFDESLAGYQRCLDFLNAVRKQSSGVKSKHVSRYAVPPKIGRLLVTGPPMVGGFGLVFPGIDPNVGWSIAIKVPKPELLSSTELIERFINEAKAVAQLEHPNIVRIFECNWHGITPYIVMPFIEGPSLAVWRASQNEVSPRTAVEMVRQLAQAMSHAHEKGILHRDIKPGNVLLRLGTTETSNSPLGFAPILTDFGLAKIQEGNLAPTQTGTVMGTFDYMSPEQAAGKSELIGIASDIYALGAMLHFVLTGVPPLRGSNDLQTIERIVNQEPQPILVSGKSVHRDLEVICQKCLSKSPEDRYGSCAELAGDLQRFLNGEPIKARPCSKLSKAIKWIRRNPRWSVLLLISTFSLLSLIASTLHFNSRMNAQLEVTAREQRSATRHENDARRRAYILDMQKARESKFLYRFDRALELLESYIPSKDGLDLRDFAWWHLWHELTQSKVLGRHANGEIAVAARRDGLLAASGGVDGVIRLWNLANGELVCELFDDKSNIESLGFSPDGQHLLSASASGRLVMWDITTKQRIWSCHEPRSRIYQARYSSGGDLIASAHSDNNIRLWNPDNGEQIGILTGHTDEVRCLAFHPYESTLASGSIDGTIRLWNLKNCSPDIRSENGIFQKRDTASWPRILAFEQDGKRLVTATGLAEIIQLGWDSDRFGKEINRQFESVIPRCLLCSRDGLVITGRGTGDICVEYGIPVFGRGSPLIGHTDALSSLAMSAAEDFLISASKDGSVRLWTDFRTRSRLPLVVGPSRVTVDDASAPQYSIQWHGEYLAADFQPDSVSVYSVPERRLVKSVPKSKDDRFALSPLGRFVLLYKNTGGFSVHRLSDSHIEWNNQLPAYQRRDDFNPRPAWSQGEEILAVAIGKEVLLLSMRDGSIIHKLEHPAFANEILFREMPDNQLMVISACEDGCLRFWDCESGALKNTHRTHSQNVRVLGISLDQKSIATVGHGSYDCSLRLWNLDDLSESSVAFFNSHPAQVQFLSDALIVFQQGSLVTGWDINGEVELFRIGLTNLPRSFAVSPDRHQLAIPRDSYIEIVDGRPDTAIQPKTK